MVYTLLNDLTQLDLISNLHSKLSIITSSYIFFLDVPQGSVLTANLLTSVNIRKQIVQHMSMAPLNDIITILLLN